METESDEIVSQSNLGGITTSGGGFSTFYTRPSFQKAAVAGYFAAATVAGTKPYPGYSVTGRGYPDVALAAVKYAVFIGDGFYGVSGTSASAPVLAGMFSNINAARRSAGKGPIGWANPALYNNRTMFVRDITSGHNKCSVTSVCCAHGYTATKGWDPTTGLGTVDYEKLQSYLVQLGSLQSSRPTMLPTMMLKTSHISVSQVRVKGDDCFYRMLTV